MSLARWMACWSSRNVLDLYVDGRLTAAQTARVREHLHGCAECAREERALRPVKLDLPVEVPAGLVESILKKFEEGAEPRAFARPAWRLQPAQAAAFVYLALLASGNLAPGAVSQGLPGTNDIFLTLPSPHGGEGTMERTP